MEKLGREEYQINGKPLGFAKMDKAGRKELADKIVEIAEIISVDHIEDYLLEALLLMMQIRINFAIMDLKQKHVE